MGESTDLQRLTAWVRRRIDDGVSRPVKLAVPGEGVIRVVGDQVSNEDGPADLIITVSAATLSDVWNDRLNPLALPKGALKVSNKLLALQMLPRLMRLLAHSG